MGTLRRVLAVGGLAAAAAGCQKCEKAHIHLDNRTGVTCQVYLDGAFLATMGPNASRTQDVKDGNHSVSADCSTLVLSEKLDCGSDWFVTID